VATSAPQRRATPAFFLVASIIDNILLFIFVIPPFFL
jgi:hypothetical protein